MNFKHHITNKPQRKTEKKIGDFEIFLQIKESECWKYLFRNPSKALGIVLLNWFIFSKSLLNYAFTSVFRTGHGVRQTGYIATFFSLCLLCSINSDHFYPLFKGTLGMCYLPLCVFWQELPEIEAMLCTDVHSQGLKRYTALATLLSFFNATRAHLGFANQEDQASRGDSWLYIAVNFLRSRFKKRKTKTNKLVIEAIVEPTALIVTAIFLFDHDRVFSLVLLGMALTEILIQISNRAIELKEQALINA